MSQFTCYVADKGTDGQVTGKMTRRDMADLPEGNVLVKVAFSSLNYKDALAATGHPGVVRKLPHVPGIDAAGEVVESGDADLPRGRQVLVTGYDLGAGRWGGWAEYVRVPAEWVVPLPEGLSPLDAMRLGTAGFTAAPSVDALIRQEIGPDAGEIVVTGATGGVGCLAVAILARLGYRVAAVTGKKDRHEWLSALGARKSDRSLRGRHRRGQPAAEGHVGRHRRHRRRQYAGDFAPFHADWRLRHGVRSRRRSGFENDRLSLHSPRRRVCGIDSGWCRRERRLELWRRLAGPWKPEQLAEVSKTVDLKDIDETVRQILAGQIVGRTVVRVSDS